MAQSITGIDAGDRPPAHPGQVASVVPHLPSEDQVDRVSAVFKLLGDPTRVRLLYALLQAEELCVCDLASATALTETTVSQALRLLRASGVVTGRRAGRNVFYRLSDAHVRMVLDLTRQHVSHQGAFRRAGSDVVAR